MKASPGRMRDNASDEYAGSRSLRDRSQARSLAGTVFGTRAMLSTRRMACSFTTDGALQGLGKGEATLRLTALVHAVEQSQVSVAMEPAPARTGLARHIIWHSGAHRTVGGEPCRNRRQRLDLNCRPTTIILP